MKPCCLFSSPLRLRLRLRLRSSLIAVSLSTQIKPTMPSLPAPEPPSPPHPDAAVTRLYLQSLYTQIKALSKNPRNYLSLTALDSLLAKTHLLDPATTVIVIDYLSQIKKLVRGKRMLSVLKSSGKVSDCLLYSLVFDFLLKDGKINDVENAWAEICGSQKRFDFSKYVTSVCKFGGFDEIKDICERILMGGGSALEKQSYFALVGALCRVNQGLLAKEIVKEMYDKGMEVDDWTYFQIFQSFCRNGDVDEADLVLRRLVRSGFTIDVCVYGSFLHGLCRSGKFREADKLFKKLRKGSSMEGSRERGLVLEGRRAIFQLSCMGAVPEIIAYESYFRALCNNGKLGEAEVLLKKMMSGRTVPEVCVYVSFIKALFRAGRDEDAMKFFSVQRKKGLVHVDEIARYLIICLCEKGKVDDALRLSEEITVVPGVANDSNVYNSILNGYWKGSRVAEAEHFFETLPKNTRRPNALTYSIMFSGYCDHGDVSKAIIILEEMLRSKMGVNGALYERLVRGLYDGGREDEAFKYMNEMIEKGYFIFCKRWRALLPSLLSTIET